MRTIRPYQDGASSGAIQREQEIRRDNDTVKIPKVTLFDIDYAIFYHLTEVLKLRVNENGNSIPVPAMFTSGEKWSQIRQHGYLRDVNKKVLAPLIAIRRTSVAADDRLPMVDVNNYNPTFRLVPYRTFNMQYDRVAGQYLNKESHEFYLVDVPDYVRVGYELILWTDLQEQMNNLVQPIVGISDHVWGDFYKFRTNVQDVTHDNVNVPGEDRLVKTTITLQVDGYLRGEFEYQNSKMQKAHSIKKVKFLEEGTDKVVFDQQEDYTTPNRFEPNIADEIPSDSIRRKIRL